MSPYVDENPDYWDDYNNLQRVKHELLRLYLGGWFPILGSWSGRITYIDCNAGRGRHSSGEPGSPLIALRTFLGHPFRDRILRNCEVSFFFIEADKGNKEHLESILSGIKCPPKVEVEVKLGEFENILQSRIGDLRTQQTELPPTFVFVDPYGFTLPGKLLAQLKAFDKCELFITFMWRWIDMALKNPALAENMDSLFVTTKWRNLPNIQDADERCEAAIRLLKEQLGAKYFTRVKMLGEHSEIKYILIHATNHPKGRGVMLEAVWKICPTGGFKVRINDNPHQEFLIKPEPDLEPLKQWLWSKFRNKTVKTEHIYATMNDENNGTFYLKKHLHEALKEMHSKDQITCLEKLIFSHNPAICFVQKQIKPSGKG